MRIVIVAVLVALLCLVLTIALWGSSAQIYSPPEKLGPQQDQGLEVEVESRIPEAVILDVPERDTRLLAGEAEPAGSDVTGAIGKEPLDSSPQFNLAEYRLSVMEQLRTKLETAKRGSFDEWNAAYGILFHSMLVHEDITGTSMDGNGSLITTRLDDRFTSFSDGRVYKWSAGQYPELAEMTLKKQDLASKPLLVPLGSSIESPILTASQQSAVDKAYVQALSELQSHGK